MADVLKPQKCMCGNKVVAHKKNYCFHFMLEKSWGEGTTQRKTIQMQIDMTAPLMVTKNFQTIWNP